MPRKKHHGLCPLCGREALLTRDHIPPDGIFLPPKPDNLITVRTCRACNEGTKLDDEYFRLCLTPSPNASPEQWRLWNEKIYGSTLKRSPKLRSRLVQLTDAVKEHHKTSPLEFIDGTPLTDEQIEQTLSLEKSRIDRVVEKIVRCLYHHCTDAVLPGEIKADISLVALKDHVDQLAEPCGTIGNHREFVFWYDGLAEVLGSTWLLLFYEAQLFKAELHKAV
jgi:hypothetical protein